MIVTFISQCEKKALKKTRRVLDAFANRIGSNTWQTVITNEGLQAVKKLLRKTASKNTAVSCHWVRSRNRIEMVWIVGNRAKFNCEGCVPVNSTKKTIMNTQWENDWQYLPLIKALSALAALFHDWGKASEFFQTKLKQKRIIGDPLRHEWISTLFLNAFVANDSDSEWLARLANGDINESSLKAIDNKKIRNPLAGLPNTASLLAWLIVTHHRLPNIGEEYSGTPVNSFNELFQAINQTWGYENSWDDAEFKKNLERCFDYSKGLPSYSNDWLKQAKKWANKLHDCLGLVEKSIADGSWRLVLHHARLALMLGDHHYSSCEADSHWKSDLKLFANTDRKTGKLKQKLDEHLAGVMAKALKISHMLPAFESNQAELPRAYDIKKLKQKSPKEYRWQDIAVTTINQWRKQQPKTRSFDQFGFFAVNMASTGKGKTFANAKIMRALSPDEDSLRYILALGLRALTLQTGDEYRGRIKLDETDMAVLIGSRAVLDLHQRNKKQQQKAMHVSNDDIGSESLETLMDNDIDYESALPEGILSTIFTKNSQGKRNRKFLYAPVLVCTIDHLMGATETTRGGRYILPSLRLMSSDLVIDEVDDFNGKDLIAIGRLIHLAGMLGRKVMISSATIPPDLAEGYFNAYQAGWAVFATSRERSHTISCAWIDEFTTQIKDTTCGEIEQKQAEFRQNHQDFIKARVKKLKKETVKRKAEIIDCHFLLENTYEQTVLKKHYYETIKQTIIKQHQRHYFVDQQTKTQVSFGVVRMANIPPCIALTQYLAETEWAKDIEIRVMAYHSQQILLMRSLQEAHLDKVLKRNKETDNEQPILNDSIIRSHLNHNKANNLIFILVATPVEEVGRDHDFDWAVIEPSSFRSIIQLAGRVLRHRKILPEKANLALMQYNLKSLTQEEKLPAYHKPGYETKENHLSSHNLSKLIDSEKLAICVDSQPRIQSYMTLEPSKSLIDLEHYSIRQLLTSYKNLGPETLQGWLTGCWWMTALPQAFNRFREGSKRQKVYVIPEDNQWLYVEKESKKGKLVMPSPQTLYNIKMIALSHQQQSRLWIQRDYKESLEEIAEQKEISVRSAALRYGELNLPTYGKNALEIEFYYYDQLGLVKI